ncbi:MAG TPA: hypothetical protein PK395_02010 [bacterium]|nr:hypothetical protein [bacterium]HQP97441.1 hypothetical protein [bacterium]
MNGSEKRKGPWTHRFLVWLFSSLLTLLLLWLLGFIMRDIGRLPGPDREKVEEKYIDASLKTRLENLEKEHRTLTGQIENQREIQGILRTSTDSSRETMNQLLAVHRLNLERNVTPTEAEQKALAESETLFLENQRKFQEANQEISLLSEQARVIQEQIGILQKEIEEKRETAREDFEAQFQVHEFKVAALKLAFLIPLVLLAGWFLIYRRSRAYAPIIYSTFIATFWQTGLVIHEHFPTELFKYIALGTAIAIVLAVLIHLIRTVTAPKKNWLLKQYRESYNRLRCPICAYPIQRGPFKYAFWTAKGPRIGIAQDTASERGEEKSYVCPSCGERLYESCEACSAIRASLLPYCQSCGKEKTISC